MRESYLRDKGLYDDIIALGLPDKWKLSQKIDWFLAENRKLCPVCSSHCLVGKSWCSVSCRNKDPGIRRSISEKNTQNADLRNAARKKFYQTNYGVSGPLGVSESLEKARKTTKERFGETSWARSQKGKERLKEIWKDFDLKKRMMASQKEAHARVTDEEKKITLDKRKKTCLKLYGVENVFASEEIKKKINETIAEKYGTSGISSRTSSGETDVFNFVRQLLPESVLVRRNVRDVLPAGKELDIYIPELKLAIEFDGCYWHSDEQKKDRLYHKNKKDAAEALGINLVAIWDSEWNDPIKQSIWKSMISHRCGLSERKIYARQCDLREISSADAVKFFGENHISGSLRTYDFALGLMHGGELVHCIGFVKPRFTPDFEWEIGRAASKRGCSVVGAYGKLMRAFVERKNPASIISYEHRRFSLMKEKDGVGFLRFERKTDPTEFFFHAKEPQPKTWQAYTREKLKRDFPEEVIDAFPTIREFLKFAGYLSIFDCGNNVYVYKKLPEPR